MFLDEKSYANYHCDQYRTHKDSVDCGTRIGTFSVGELSDVIKGWIRNCEANHYDPYQTPVFVAAKYSRGKEFCFNTSAVRVDSIGMSMAFEVAFDGPHSDRIYYVAPDSKPEEGEYWESRGVSDGHDVSGFVVSKKAGERLLNMVRIVLDEQKPKSRLDYRETEPNWIQFKFDPEEFDLHKLDEMSREAGGVMTFDILGACVVKKEEE